MWLLPVQRIIFLIGINVGDTNLSFKNIWIAKELNKTTSLSLPHISINACYLDIYHGKHTVVRAKWRTP